MTPTRSFQLSIGKAIKQVHNKNLIHRDVKPANILLTNEGQTLLIDFADACSADRSQKDLIGVPVDDTDLYRKQIDKIIGTLEYYAPEYAKWALDKSLPNPTTKAIDVWAFLLTCYYIWYGVEFSGNCPSSKSVKDQSDVAWAFGGKIDPLGIEDMLKVDPNERPTIDQILDHLSQI